MKYYLCKWSNIVVESVEHFFLTKRKMPKTLVVGISVYEIGAKSISLLSHLIVIAPTNSDRATFLLPRAIAPLCIFN